MIYLDHATLAPPSTAVFSQMDACMRTHWHATTAPYLLKKEPFCTIDTSLASIRGLIGAHVEDAFQLYGSGSHALSEVYHSVYMSHILEHGKNHVLMPDAEEDFIEILEKSVGKLGVYAKTVPVNSQGKITPDALEKALTPKAGFVSISWANPLTGVIQPVSELGEVCVKHGVLFHVDASHVLGKVYFDFAHFPIDYLTFEGTSIHGPKGSGALFAKQHTLFQSRLPPSIEQETLNLPALTGLGVASRELTEAFDHLCLETLRLKEKLETGIVGAIPEAYVLFKEEMRLPNITCIVFPGVTGELLAFHLQHAGVLPSFRPGEKLARFLIHLGLDSMSSHSALTFSLSYTTTEEEIDRAIQVIVDVAQKCQTFSKEMVR